MDWVGAECKAVVASGGLVLQWIVGNNSSSIYGWIQEIAITKIVVVLVCIFSGARKLP